MYLHAILNNSLFLIPVTTGSIFIIVGLIMYKFPPKKINKLYGYRTNKSMKSQQHWDFSQVFAAKQMIILGFCLALSSIIGLFYFPEEDIGAAIGLSLLIIVCIILVVRVERAIKLKFD